MRTWRALLGGLGWLLLLLPRPAAAEFTLKAEWASSYIWRGFDLNPDRKPVVQPSLEYVAGESGLSLEIWSSFSFENRDLSEIDFTLMYTGTVGESLELAAGLVHYGWYIVRDFRFKEDTTQEVFASAGLPHLPLSPYLTLYYDFANGEGFYGLAEAEYGAAWGRSLGFSFYASLGYNGGQWLEPGAKPGFSDFNLRVSLPLSLGKVQVIPYAQATLVLLDSVGTENFFWYGVSLSIDI